MYSRGKGKEKAKSANINITQLLRIVHTNDIDLFLTGIEEYQVSLSNDEFLAQCQYLQAYALSFNCFNIVAALRILAPQALSPLAQVYFDLQLPVLHHTFDKTAWRQGFKTNLPPLPTSDNDLADKLECLTTENLNTLLDTVLSPNFLTDTTPLSNELVLLCDLLFANSERTKVREELIQGLRSSTHVKLLGKYWNRITFQNDAALMSQVIIIFSRNPFFKSLVTTNPADIYHTLAPELFLPPLPSAENKQTSLDSLRALLALGLDVQPIVINELSTNKSHQISLLLESGWSPFNLLLEYWDINRAAFYKLFGLALEDQLEYLIIAATIGGKQVLIDEVIADDFSLDPFLAERKWNIGNCHPPANKDENKNNIETVIRSFQILQADLQNLDKALWKMRPRVLVWGGIANLLVLLETIAAMTQAACGGNPLCHKEGDDQLVLSSAYPFCLGREASITVARNVNCTNFQAGAHYPADGTPDGGDIGEATNRLTLLNLTENFDIKTPHSLYDASSIIVSFSSFILVGMIMANLTLYFIPSSYAITSSEHRDQSKNRYLQLILEIERLLSLHKKILTLCPDSFTTVDKAGIMDLDIYLEKLRHLFVLPSRLSSREILYLNIVKPLSKLISNLQKNIAPAYLQSLANLSQEQWTLIMPALQTPLLQIENITTQNATRPPREHARLFSRTQKNGERQPLLSINDGESLEAGVRLSSSSSHAS